MTQKNSTKRALVASLLAMVMTVTMLMGTTFAWFTDSVTSSGNVIKTGTLDVEMYWKDGKTDPAADSDWTDASTGAIFNYDLWEPGFAQVRHVKIANGGTLDLKYTVKIVANGTVTDLTDAIDVYYADPAIQVADRAALAGATKLGTLTEVLNGLGETGNGTLTAKTEDVITLALVMQEGAGNQYMDKSIGTTFSVQVLATQLASESDSFDDLYDVDATYLNKDESGAWLINNVNELYYFAAEVNGGNSFKGETVKLNADINLAGYSWTPIGSGEVNGQWIGFNGIFDGQGHTISNLKVTKGGGWNGLFGLVGRGTTGVNEIISNVNLVNVVIEGANRMSGALVGQIYGNVENCTVTGVTITAIPNATATGYDNGDKIGGLIGWLGDNNDYHFIRDCSATDVTLKAYRDVGGITGYIGYSTTVEGCNVDTVSITVDQDTNHYGVKDANAGAIVGRIYSQPVTVQNNTEANVTIDIPWDGNTTEQPASVGGVYQVGKPAELAWLAAQSNPVQKIALTADIDMRGATISSIELTSYHTVEGNGKTISNVTVDGSGLFGNVSADGEIRNITLDNVTVNTASGDYAGIVNGKYSGIYVGVTVMNSSVNAPQSEYVGGLAGAVYKNITDCHVENISVLGTEKVGGLVGFFTLADVGYSIKLENCSATNVEVTATNTAKSYAGVIFGRGLATGSYKFTFVNCSVGLKEGQKVIGQDYYNNIDVSAITVTQLP